MKSDVISVSSKGTDHTAEVLSQAERVAAYQKLSPKNALHLRLLAEETMGMVRAITKDLQGEFWIENDGPLYELHLHAVTDMDIDKRERLIAASTSGKNEAERGLMGKIRAFFEPAEDVPLYLSFDPNPYGVYSDMVWTMCVYEQQLREQLKEDREGAAQAWDELEQSVIAHVADDVKVSIRGRDVEMIVFKKMD